MNQEEDEDAFLYGESADTAAAGASFTRGLRAEHGMEPASEEGEVDDDEEDEDGSDSDIELIIETEPGKRAAPPPCSSLVYTIADSRSAQPFAHRIAPQPRPGPTPEKAPSASNQIIKAETSVAAAPRPVEGVEIDKVAEYNGQPIFNLDVESLEDKPWRKPGADASDYFNYGFDEFTWAAYCAKQTNLRKDFNPASVVAMMTGMPPEMQAMMSQFPMPPEMMFAGMPGMMPDPSAFGQFPGGGFQQTPTGPSGQQSFGGGYGGYGVQQHQQHQPPQQPQLQPPPKYHGQRIGSPARMGSPNLGVNIPSGPQAMGGQQGYRGNSNGSMRGPPRGGQRRY